MFNKKIQQKIVSKFNKETKNARKIAKSLGLKRRHVMATLENLKLRSYSSGSYL